MVIFLTPFKITLSVDFPALDNLVAFLTSQVDQQKQIDALAAQVTALTSAANQSTIRLQDAVQGEQKNG